MKKKEVKHMIIFLTSSPTGPLGSHFNGLDHQNHFVENLKKYWKPDSKCCLIAAYPDHYQENDQMCDYFRTVLTHEQFSLDCFDLIDQRYQDITSQKLQQYDVIILSGGHVPTQNQFFQSISLKEKLKDFQGIIIGISAGSMNCASTVYCQPEEPGESIDQQFQRWIEGLALTDINIIPHYQLVKDRYLDDQRLYEDITYPDSLNHRFIILVDGSYILIDDQNWLYGESYLLENGELKPLCFQNQKTII